MLKSSEKEKILTERREKQRKGERETDKDNGSRNGAETSKQQRFFVDESRMQHNEVFSVAAVVAAAAADVAV